MGSLVIWIIGSIVAGFIASKIVNKRGEGLIIDLVLGVIGGVVGGWIMTHVVGAQIGRSVRSLFGFAGAYAGEVYDLAVAVAGAVLVLIVFHALRRSR